jgi:hypothetical protein
MGTRKKVDRGAWRAPLAALIFVAALSFAGWIVYTTAINPPIPIDKRPLEVAELPATPAADTPKVAAPAPPARIKGIRDHAPCDTTRLEPRVRAVADSFPQWPDYLLGYVACRKLRRHMTKEQLRATLGKPVRVIPSTTVYRPIETWMYPNGFSVILWDGYVKNWQ